VQLHAREPVGLADLSLLKGSQGLGVLHHLEVRAANLRQHPASLVVRGREVLETVDGLLALELAQLAVGDRQLVQ